MTTGQAAGTLIMPSDAIRGLDSGSPWVMKVEAGKTVKQPVTLGLRGIGNGQVLSGVSLNDWIVTQKPMRPWKPVLALKHTYPSNQPSLSAYVARF